MKFSQRTVDIKQEEQRLRREMERSRENRKLNKLKAILEEKIQRQQQNSAS